MFNAMRVTSARELQQILELQQRYLRGKNSQQEEEEQGFVTVKHTMGLLELLHSHEPSIIVKDGQKLAAYALVMAKECRTICTELVPMFEVLDGLTYKGKSLDHSGFYVMGQVCVDKEYRGQGLFDLLYQKHKELLSDRYSFVITEIATRNLRSLRAHERVGFKTIHTYTDQLDKWAIALWDWR